MMKEISKLILKDLYLPPKDSHKGENGKLTIVGGSKLFHGASLWALKIASRMVDMVFYATVEENIKLADSIKSKLYDFICIPRGKEEDYIQESDAVLIGPGLVRGDKEYTGTGESGNQTRKLTERLLKKFPQKKWLIDAGSLQVVDKSWLKPLKQVIITPHPKEFVTLFGVKLPQEQEARVRLLKAKAKEYSCIIVVKGKEDLVCKAEECWVNKTGNEGMTKGGTGDVLAGLMAALLCKNEPFLAAQAGIFINGKAGDQLYKSKGPFFNSSDLTDQLPLTLKKLLGY